MSIKIIIILVLGSSALFSQGHIDHIKNQEYLKLKNKINCNDLPDDNLSEKICANLAFQKSDSLLTVIYDTLIYKVKLSYNDSFENKIIKLQVTWRKFRDEHCSIIYDTYEGCGGCHQRSIDYLYCLKSLTDDRINELKELYSKLLNE